MPFSVRIIRVVFLLIFLISNDSWNWRPSLLAHAFVPSTQNRANMIHLASTNEDVTGGMTATTNDQTLEPTLDLLKGWTEEYLQAALQGDRLSNAQAQEPWLAADFIQTGPNIGPLNKRDYLNAIAYFSVDFGEAIPDLSVDLDGWHMDPHNPWRVWVVLRYTGTHINPANIPNSNTVLEPQDPPRAFYNGPELFSFVWTPSRQIQWLSIGYNGDKYTGDNKGYGGIVGLLISMGASKAQIDFLNPLLNLQIWASQFTDGVSQPRSITPYSQLPDWWKVRKKLGWNIKQ